MLLEYIILKKPSAALYLGISEERLSKHLPGQTEYSIHQLEQLERNNFKSPEWIAERWTEDELICLIAPKSGYSKILQLASAPFTIKPELLAQAEQALYYSPFIGMMMDVLYYLNNHQLFRYKTMESMAAYLSAQGIFNLYTIDKAHPSYKALKIQETHLSVLENVA